jgi:hypothetical protein
MKPIIIYTSLLLCACNSSTENKKVAADDTKKQAAAITVDATTGISSFMLNGQPAIYSNSGGKHACNLSADNLHVYIQGYLPPDTHNMQMDIWIKAFPEKTGTYKAWAGYSRRDETGKEFLYNTKADGFMVNITEYTQQGGSDNFKHAIISGTFEGDLDCNVFDPALKSNPMNQILHFTNGKFEKLNVAFIK